MDPNKTIADWLRELPAEHVEAALKNHEDATKRSAFPAPEKEESVQDASLALYMAFRWDETPEGFEYWNKLFRSFDEPAS